jgi:hypothetical protein
MIALQLSIEHMKVLDLALQEMPYKAVAGLIAEINRQILEQSPPAVADPTQDV